MICVFGASGNTGGATAAYLLKNGKKIRVVARHREKLETLAKAGAECFIGDLEDKGLVREALAGAEAAYLLVPPNMATDDFRAYQDRVTETLASGVEAAGVRYVALLSSVGAQHAQGTGPIVGLHRFEERLKKNHDLNALFIRAGMFMDNVFMSMATIKTQGLYGSPLPSDAPIPFIAASDIGNYAGDRLDRLDFTGTAVVHLVGPKAVTCNDVVAALGQAVGKSIRYAQVPLDQLEKGMVQGGLNPAVVSVFMEMYRGAGQGLLTPESGGVVVQAPTAIDTWAKRAFAPAYERG
jgi:uncharacterized protein YbjT (DUF2867 family)